MRISSGRRTLSPTSSAGCSKSFSSSSISIGERNAVAFADLFDRLGLADRAVRAAAEMKAREDAARAGVHFERLFDGQVFAEMALDRSLLDRRVLTTLSIRSLRPHRRLADSVAETYAKYACKPDSVPPLRGADIISLGRTSPRASVRYSSCGRAVRAHEGHIERSCFRWGLPERASPRRSVSSYLTISPLPPNDVRRYVSVALSFESPRQDVILHPAR